jgi:O-antigen/teichoic acid export membrane protein
MKSRLLSLASDSAVYGLADVISRFLTIFLVPIYTRLFTPEDYGVLSLVNSSLAVVAIFVVLALDNSAHRWYWDTDDDLDRRRTLASWAWCQMSVATFFGAAVFLAAGLLARTIVHRPETTVYFQLAGLALPLTVLSKVATSWLRMQRRPWATTFYSLGTSLVIIGATLVLVVMMRWGLAGIFVGQIIAYAVATVVGALLLKSWISPAFVDVSRLREMLRFSLPMIPGGLAYWVVTFADRYFVEAYRDASEVGLYSVGSAIAAVVALVTGAFQMAWGPFAFSIHTQPNARQTYADAFLVYLWLGVGLSAGASLFAPEALRVLTTSQYAGAASVVGMLALSYVMIGLTYIAATGPGIAKRSGPTGVAMAGAAILNIVLNFAFVPTYGKLGSAVATLISQTVTPAYLFYRSQQIYPIPYRFGTGIGIVAVGIVVMAVGAQLQLNSVWLGVLLKLALMAAFVPLFFAMRLFTPADVRSFLNRGFLRLIAR